MFIIKEGVEPEKIGEGTSPETVEAIKKWLESQGSTIRTSEEDQSFIDQKVQEEVDGMYRKHNETIDANLLELTGVKKNSNEKTTDYMKRAISSYNERVEELQSKIAKFEKDGVNGNEQAEKYKQELETLQDQFKAQAEEYEQKLKDHKQAVFKERIETQITQKVNEFKEKFRDDLNKDFIDDVVSNRVRKFYEENNPEQLDEDHVVWKDKEGKTVNSKKDGKPMSGTEILEGYFKDLMKEKRNDKGSGSNGGEGGSGTDGNTKTHDNIKLPDTVKSKTQLHSYLSGELKMDESTKEFAEAYDALGSELPLREPR